jgi:hypothetical protein
MALVTKASPANTGVTRNEKSAVAQASNDTKPAAPWSSDFGSVRRPHFRTPEGDEWVRLPGLFRRREAEELMNLTSQRWRFALLPHGPGPGEEQLYVVLAAPLVEEL